MMDINTPPSLAYHAPPPQQWLLPLWHPKPILSDGWEQGRKRISMGGGESWNGMGGRGGKNVPLHTSKFRLNPPPQLFSPFSTFTMKEIMIVATI